MNSSPQSQNSFSPGIKYANIVATLSLLLWGIVWANLSCLNDRMRNVELDLAKIKTIHGIEAGKLPNNRLNQSLSGQAERSIPPGLASPP